MLTNESFELSPEQLQAYNDWISEFGEQILRDESPCADVEVVFHFSNLGREVIARIPGSSAPSIVLEDMLF